MLKTFIALSLLVISPLAYAATTPVEQMPSGTYTLDTSHSFLHWKVSHLGLSNYTARFTRFAATLDFNAADPTKSKLTVSVDPTSVRTDYPHADEKDFDAKLAKGEEWFNASKFPKITFVSTRIEKTGENTGLIHGDLTFLGVTKPLTLATTFNGAFLEKPFANVPALGFSAISTMQRSDWGFATYVPSIGDAVTIMIETEFHKVQE
jgi:polyisoprenoid-binding protein YceI